MTLQLAALIAAVALAAGSTGRLAWKDRAALAELHTRLTVALRLTLRGGRHARLVTVPMPLRRLGHLVHRDTPTPREVTA